MISVLVNLLIITCICSLSLRSIHLGWDLVNRYRQHQEMSKVRKSIEAAVGGLEAKLNERANDLSKKFVDIN